MAMLWDFTDEDHLLLLRCRSDQFSAFSGLDIVVRF
jgi:hypothetical protein